MTHTLKTYVLLWLIAGIGCSMPLGYGMQDGGSQPSIIPAMAHLGFKTAIVPDFLKRYYTEAPKDLTPEQTYNAWKKVMEKLGFTQSHELPADTFNERIQQHKANLEYIHNFMCDKNIGLIPSPKRGTEESFYEAGLKQLNAANNVIQNWNSIASALGFTRANPLSMDDMQTLWWNEDDQDIKQAMGKLLRGSAHMCELEIPEHIRGPIAHIPSHILNPPKVRVPIHAERPVKYLPLFVYTPARQPKLPEDTLNALVQKLHSIAYILDCSLIIRTPNYYILWEIGESLPENHLKLQKERVPHLCRQMVYDRKLIDSLDSLTGYINQSRNNNSDHVLSDYDNWKLSSALTRVIEQLGYHRDSLSTLEKHKLIECIQKLQSLETLMEKLQKEADPKYVPGQLQHHPLCPPPARKITPQNAAPQIAQITQNIVDDQKYIPHAIWQGQDGDVTLIQELLQKAITKLNLPQASKPDTLQLFNDHTRTIPWCCKKMCQSDTQAAVAGTLDRLVRHVAETVPVTDVTQMRQDIDTILRQFGLEYNYDLIEDASDYIIQDLFNDLTHLVDPQGAEGYIVRPSQFKLPVTSPEQNISPAKEDTNIESNLPTEKQQVSKSITPAYIAAHDAYRMGTMAGRIGATIGFDYAQKIIIGKHITQCLKNDCAQLIELLQKIHIDLAEVRVHYPESESEEDAKLFAQERYKLFEPIRALCDTYCGMSMYAHTARSFFASLTGYLAASCGLRAADYAIDTQQQSSWSTCALARNAGNDLEKMRIGHRIVSALSGGPVAGCTITSGLHTFLVTPLAILLANKQYKRSLNYYIEHNSQKLLALLIEYQEQPTDPETIAALDAFISSEFSPSFWFGPLDEHQSTRSNIIRTVMSKVVRAGVSALQVLL